MPAVEVVHIVKAYADKVAVDDLSFMLEQNEIFGLIGPNGAGKTTAIRMMMDIIKPDSGRIAIFGEKLSEATKRNLGYLPEERGLYRKQRVIDSIIYLASLKGMDKRSAAARADELLSKTGMLPNKNKKIEELSKGMSQIIQFIVTIMHDPELLIMDEPFSGLDPVNTETLIQMLLELRQQGKAIILSTHQMNQVEELCDRLLMINKGQAVLYGSLKDIKSKYRSNAVILEYDGELGELQGVSVKSRQPGRLELALENGTTARMVLDQLAKKDAVINRFELATPSLNEIFLKVVGQNHE